MCSHEWAVIEQSHLLLFIWHKLVRTLSRQFQNSALGVGNPQFQVGYAKTYPQFVLDGGISGSAFYLCMSLHVDKHFALRCNGKNPQACITQA